MNEVKYENLRLDPNFMAGINKIPDPWEWFIKLWNNFTEEHIPIKDTDKDGKNLFIKRNLSL